MRTQQAPSLRGVVCSVCNKIGEHFSTACPDRFRVGVPKSKQLEITNSTNAATAPATDTHDDFVLTTAEFEALVSKMDMHTVPDSLRCAACTLLPFDAIWCNCCHVVTCAACLGMEEEDKRWMCPICNGTADEQFQIIQALRDTVDALRETVIDRCLLPALPPPPLPPPLPAPKPAAPPQLPTHHPSRKRGREGKRK